MVSDLQCTDLCNNFYCKPTSCCIHVGYTYQTWYFCFAYFL